jgi:hypothetical protein
MLKKNEKRRNKKRKGNKMKIVQNNTVDGDYAF